MSTELISRDEYTGTVKKHNLEPKRSSRRKQISNAAKEKVPSYEAHQSLKFEKKCEVEFPFAQPYIDRNIGLRQQIDNEHVVQLKPSENFQKPQLRSKMEKQDELVRHMSNLPAYLQRVEKHKNVQEKALNFGVLDWKRLEKWKYNERMPARGQRKASLSSNSLSMANGSPSLTKTSLQRKQSSPELHLKSSHEVRLPDSVQQFPGKTKCTQDSQTTSFRTVSGQQIDISQKVTSSSRSYPERENVKGMRIKVDQKTTTTMQKAILSSNQIGQTSLSSLPTTDQYRKRKTTKGDETNPCPKYSADEPQPIVLLVPKVAPKRSSAKNSQLAESRASYDGDLAQNNQKRFSNCSSSQELHSVELYDEIPLSSPLPASVSIAPGIRSDVCACPHQNDPPITSSPSEVKCRLENSSDDCSVSVETSKGMDLDTAELPAVKGRHSSSPIRRFSFSLGRLSRSFSFKESSTIPKLSSTYEAAKSGPVSSEVLAGIDDCFIDKAHAGERRRSSPFRRLIDPILKPKGAQAARMAQPSDKISISVTSGPINTNKRLPEQIHQASTFQAILQLTIKNGLPYFKFVVDKSSDILAAAVKKPPTSGKADCSLTYTFYSVCEIKKKTVGWISHGSKEKSCIAYNIIAEMKSIYRLSDMLRESVLYTVDIRKGEKGPPEVLPNKEIAATVVKDPAAKLKGEERKEVNECKQEGLVQSSLGNIFDRGEKEDFNSTIAILPGGVHSSPNGSTPSSLIDRWKSGGLCDCGGWDIGCKLRVLTDKNIESNCSTSDTSSSVLERIDLFNQDREGRSQPNFSLMPLKDGLYSVKFNASISSLEAFSISVAAITSKKLPEILDMGIPPEAKLSTESMEQAKKIKNPDTIQSQLPAKYVPSPPPSPVGRI